MPFAEQVVVHGRGGVMETAGQLVLDTYRNTVKSPINDYKEQSRNSLLCTI